MLNIGMGLAGSAKVSKKKFVGLTSGFLVNLKVGSYSLNPFSFFVIKRSTHYVHKI